MSRYALAIGFLVLASCTPVEKLMDGYRELTQHGGPTLTYVDVPLLREGGKCFKDHNRNGMLDPYEDWRLTPEERAADLAAKLPPEYLSGLMTIGHTVNVPGISSMSVSGITYNGKPYQESGAEPSDICDRLRDAIENFDTRQILLAHSDGPETIARWNNKVQALCESLPWGIPSLNCTDPRNEIKATDEFNAGSGGICSQWPTPLGLAATFDTTVVVDFAKTVQREYRALGFGTALSPQADLATDPRWRRVPGTFGENPELVRAMSSAYIRAMQPGVNCIVKHWPGGGAGEGGRDAHLSIGKYAVFPGGRLRTHMDVFCLDAGGVMPYYTVSYGQDPSGENVGNSYSSYIIDTLLRKQYGYEGIVCTDWGIVPDYNCNPLTTGGKCYGVESLTRGERIFKALEAGVDEFGGEVFASWLMDAYKLWSERYGEDSARERWEASARKILAAFFRSGVFENPYRSPSEAVKVLSDPDAQVLGEEAQRRSVVMLKNRAGALPAKPGAKVYIPLRHIPGVYSMTGRLKKAPYVGYSVDTAEVAKHYTIAQSPSEADFALVAITEPEGGIGYKDGQYMPISLQYSPYTASEARAVSIAGGDPAESSVNRSYRGRRIEVENASDLDLVRDTKAKMCDKPVVVLLQTTRPVVMEFEPWADAILVAFGVRSKAFLDIVSGSHEPSGRLPMQFPASMDEVEHQQEDVPEDMTPWRDTEGNAYHFGFGLDWSGRISSPQTYPAWLDQAVFYHIFPSSFKDSDGDGYGDLEGIRSKLDYIQYMGFNTIWLGPIFRSPFKDAGYDIEDYYSVDPRFGSNADLVRLVEEAHAKGIRICLDLVAGHTSDRHPWFRKSASEGPDGRYARYYIWTEGKAVKPPKPDPDSAADWVDNDYPRDGYYLKNYYDCQPALNYGYLHPRPDAPWEEGYDDPGPRAVREEIKKIMAFWFEKGIDGFRCDLAWSLVKGDDEHFSGVRRLWAELFRWQHEHYPGKVFLSEWSSPVESISCGFDIDIIRHKGCGTTMYRDLVYNTLRSPDPRTGAYIPCDCWFDKAGRGRFDTFAVPFEEMYRKTRGRGFPAMPTSSHDTWRLNRNQRNSTDQLKTAMTFFLTMPWVPVVYYGEEIGMRSMYGAPQIEGSRDRSAGRTPMQWGGGPTASFSTADPSRLYLPVDSSPDRPEVESQMKDPSSLLSWTRELLSLRAAHPALGNTGDWCMVTDPAHPYPVIYRRTDGKETFLVALNPRQDAASATIHTSGVLTPVWGDTGAVETFSKSGQTLVTLQGVSSVILREKQK